MRTTRPWREGRDENYLSLEGGEGGGLLLPGGRGGMRTRCGHFYPFTKYVLQVDLLADKD